MINLFDTLFWGGHSENRSVKMYVYKEVIIFFENGVLGHTPSIDDVGYIFAFTT